MAAADLSTELSTDLLPIREIVHQDLVRLQTSEYSAPEPQHDLLAQLTYQTGLLDQILSASSDMILILDRRLRFTYTNSVSRRVLKAERHFFLGKTLQEIDYFFLGDFASNCEQVFANGQAIYAEFTISANHENKVFEYSLNPIYGINHEIDAVICVAKDITRQRQSDLALQVAEKNYHNVFELANDSIFIAELATQRIFSVNQKASRRLGYTRQELLQLTMNDVMMPLADDRREEILQELQTTGSVTFEHQQRHKTGKGVPAEFSCHMVEYEGKLAVQSFVRDITEQQRVEAQLRHLEAALAKAMNTAANPIDLEDTSEDLEDISEQSTDIQCSCGEDD
ncbi:PAS domain-containing protein [Thermocoleostomius sinensis]|uniref:PAS domain-containing protein n=1 Tax=Thermocoleostomius sinensis A174 TaxID=2016057 RepID=A0A9E8ZAI1_9CYAN|nr:PAS domain-containing protein [Thermocoleostomius sinensis]WAL59242.1 PAS domain-containing protein [Thermocoleostomius sinensis A174]